MTVSIIIPTHKRPELALRLLRSIEEQDFPRAKLQTLLISNLRDERLRRAAPYWESALFDFKYREIGLVGVNKARNMGIRLAGGDILYFLDDDCLLPNKSHLRNLVLEHERNPQAMGIGGGYKPLGDLDGMEKFYQESSEKWIRDSASSKEFADQLLGGNSSYKREAFDKGFCFDPLISFGGSEESFNRSLREQGWALLYRENLWLFHALRLGWPAFIKKSFKQGLGLFKNRSQTKENLWSLKKDWAFLTGSEKGIYSLAYAVFFKLGYFWALASMGKESPLFRLARFAFLIVKSRWRFFKDYFIKRLYGRVFLRLFGGLWYALGWLYGSVFLRLFGVLWYALGWLYGLCVFEAVWEDCGMRWAGYMALCF